MEYIKLYNGVDMPKLGIGLYQLKKEETHNNISNAINIGFRSFDLAQTYGGEEEIGNTFKSIGIERKELFLTSKVWVNNYGYDICKTSVYATLDNLKTDYLDLMILHHPFSDYYGAYRALEDLYDEGVLRAIGVSNFYPDRLVDLCNFSRISPMVNQVEVHPFNQQIEAKTWMDKYNVVMEGWAPFAEGKNGIFENPVLKKIALKYGKSVAQVILRWNIDRDIVVIPGTSSPEHMTSNMSIFNFKLEQEDMLAIESLDRKMSSFFSHQDPSTVEWFVAMMNRAIK